MCKNAPDRVGGLGVPVILDFRVTLPRARRATDRPGYMMRYSGVFDLDVVSYTEDELMQALRAAGVGCAVLQSEWAAGDYRAQNERAAEIVARHPELVAGFASVDAAEGTAAVYELKRSVEELGLRGLNLQPFASKLLPNDKRFYPLYWKCLEYGIPVAIHTGVNYSADRSIDYGRPIYVDEVACDFPELNIVLNHGGWPWVHESVAIARKHPQVYIETGGIAPMYLAKAGSGWEMLLALGNNLLQDQIIFATDSMVPFERAVSEAQELPWKDDVKRKFLYENGTRLLDAVA
jgi:predicted TIM-barrel fold metal-dependent hydrolase